MLREYDLRLPRTGWASQAEMLQGVARSCPPLATLESTGLTRLDDDKSSRADPVEPVLPQLTAGRLLGRVQLLIGLEACHGTTESAVRVSVSGAILSTWHSHIPALPALAPAGVA